MFCWSHKNLSKSYALLKVENMAMKDVCLQSGSAINARHSCAIKGDQVINF